MASREKISAELVRSLIDYDPLTGIFRRKSVPLSESYKRRYGVLVRQSTGKVIGHLRPDGYVEVLVARKIYLAHRLAWLYITGEWPSNEIDHKNTVRNNNWFDNLREATPRQNQANRSIGKNNTSGIKCVKRMPSGKWGANIVIDRKAVWLGTFDTAELASAAYLAMSAKVNGEFARAA